MKSGCTSIYLPLSNPFRSLFLFYIKLISFNKDNIKQNTKLMSTSKKTAFSYFERQTVEYEKNNDRSIFSVKMCIQSLKGVFLPVLE